MAHRPNPALYLVLPGLAPCFLPSSLPLVKEQLHLYSPKITFVPLEATTRLMWPQVKMSLIPLVQLVNGSHTTDLKDLCFQGYPGMSPKWEGCQLCSGIDHEIIYTLQNIVKSENGLALWVPLMHPSSQGEKKLKEPRGQVFGQRFSWPGQLLDLPRGNAVDDFEAFKHRCVFSRLCVSEQVQREFLRSVLSLGGKHYSSLCLSSQGIFKLKTLGLLTSRQVIYIYLSSFQPEGWVFRD